MTQLHIENPARTRLEAGEVSLGIGIRHVRAVDIASMMRTAGMDWLFLDFEHGPMDLETAAQISVAALEAGIAPIVRVPQGDLGLAARALDSGALGIVMPHVENAVEARHIVRKLKYRPAGERGVTGMLPQFRYRTVELGAAVAELNRSMLIAVMLESPEAVAHAGEIAAVEGIDVLMIGTNDYAMALGRPGKFDDEGVVKAYDAVGRACRIHGKWLGSGGLNDAALFERYIAMDARFILAGQDVAFLMSAARQRVEMLRKINLRTERPAAE